LAVNCSDIFIFEGEYLMKKAIATWICWTCLTIPAWAVVEVEGFFWLMTPQGEASLGIDGLQGTKVDLKNDFGYDDTENVPGFRFVFGNTHQGVLSAFQLGASAENTINRTIRFGQNDFHINEHVSSAFDLTILQGFYRFNIGPDSFHGGLLAGAEYISISAEASSPRLGKARGDVDTGMILIGAFAESNPLSYLRIRGTLMAGTFDIGDVKATYLDMEFAALAIIPPGFHAGVGYRYIGVDAEDTNLPVEIDLSFSGPTLFVGFEW
jgi:hypothetical protein